MKMDVVDLDLGPVPVPSSAVGVALRAGHAVASSIVAGIRSHGRPDVKLQLVSVGVLLGAEVLLRACVNDCAVNAEATAADDVDRLKFDGAVAFLSSLEAGYPVEVDSVNELTVEALNAVILAVGDSSGDGQREQWLGEDPIKLIPRARRLADYAVAGLHLERNDRLGILTAAACYVAKAATAVLPSPIVIGLISDGMHRGAHYAPG